MINSGARVIPAARLSLSLEITVGLMLVVLGVMNLSELINVLQNFRAALNLAYAFDLLTLSG